MLRRLTRAITIATILAGGPSYGQTTAKPETDIDRAQTAIDRGDPAQALDYYERVPAKAPERRTLLAGIVALRTRQLTSDSDLRVVVEACRAQVAARTTSCLANMRKVADDAGTDMRTRLAAASVLVEGRSPGAEAMLTTLVGIAANNDPAAAADALTGLPPATSVPSLALLAAGDNLEAKYVATLALVRGGSKDAMLALKGVAADSKSGGARIIAHSGLAALGDPESLRILNETLPLMKGIDLLEAGRALVRMKDPRGAQVLRSIGEGSDDVVKVQAAEALYPLQPDVATRIIRSASENPNPWLRAQALEAATRLRITPTVSMRRAMLDRNSWVAVRAVQALTADTIDPSKTR